MPNEDILKSLIANDLSSTLRLGRPDGWRPSFTGIVLTFDRGEVVLAYPALKGRDTLFSTPLAGPFLAQTRYFFGFHVFIERGTYLSNPDSAQIDWQGTRLTTLSTRSTRIVIAAGTVLATFSSGGAAAIEIPVGSGRVIALGFEPGTTYLNVGKVPGGPFRGQFTTAFQAGMRSILLGFASNSGLDLRRPIWTDDPLVEVSRLDHPVGGAAILLNYNNEPVQNLQVHIPGVYRWVQ